MSKGIRSIGAVVLAGLTVWGCAPRLLPFETHTAQVMTYPGSPAITDGRTRFREILCGLSEGQPELRHRTPDCRELLWHLDDEGPFEPASPLPAPFAHLRVLIVPGAFEECYPAFGMPFEEAAAEWVRKGLFVRFVPVSGRGSADQNAGEIASAIARLPRDPSQPIVLIGYSKGAVDALHFAVDYPDLAERVAAVVSVAGPINGSPLADWLSGFYARVLSWMPLSTCPPMDAGVVDSLRHERQVQWLSSHRLPRHIRYFSLVTFTRRENICPLMLFSYDLLAATDPRNDGYVLWTDQVIPGATLLGYVNLDHYDVALPVRERLNVGGQKSQSEARKLLFASILSAVSETLGTP